MGDTYLAGSGFISAMTVTNVFYVPFLYTGAAADGAGAVHQRSNAWATGRGTLIFNDQTADVLAVAALASDTPSNGQVPTWNTGGTITWETPSATSSVSNFITTAHGSIYVTNSVTAGSFIGSGTGTPILKLQTMMSADNAFAITVAPNRTATTTNIFDFTSVSAAQVISAHSSSAGQVVWTNGAAASSAYTLGGALVTTTVPSSAGITVGTGFTLHPTVSGLQQNASGAATAPLGRLYFHQNVVISHINLNGSSQIQTTTNLALMLMTNGVAATNMTAVLVGNDSRFVATNTTDTVTLLAGSYLTMLMTNNAGIPSANWVWSFKVTPQ